jgi:hypothetical protein
LSFAYNLPFDAVQDNRLYDTWYRQAFERACRTLGRTAEGRPNDTPGPALAADPAADAPRQGGLVVDWTRRIGRSADWLFEQIEQHCDDPRLAELCRASLRSHLEGDRTLVPAVLMGLAPCLAKAYLSPRRSGSPTVRERVGGAWRRVAATLAGRR